MWKCVLLDMWMDEMTELCKPSDMDIFRDSYLYSTQNKDKGLSIKKPMGLFSLTL